jgi:hypothetical protein
MHAPASVDGEYRTKYAGNDLLDLETQSVHRRGSDWPVAIISRIVF